MRPIDDYDPDYDSDYDPQYDDPDYDDRPYNDRRYHEIGKQAGGSKVKKWLIGLGLVFVVLPLSCCGGLLLWSTMHKEFQISEGRHLGGPAMNFEFRYKYDTDSKNRAPIIFVRDAYFLVGETADGIRRERSLRQWAAGGKMPFHFVGIGPAEKSKFPVTLWIEKESFRGGRSKASNKITIDIKP